MRLLILTTFFMTSVVAIVVGLISIPAYYIEKMACLGKYVDYEPSYSYWSGCLINHEGKRTPAETLKTLN